MSDWVLSGLDFVMDSSYTHILLSAKNLINRINNFFIYPADKKIFAAAAEWLSYKTIVYNK